MKFNTAIAAMMGLLNEIFEVGQLTVDEFKIFIRLLCPIAPHICEELWEEIGGQAGQLEYLGDYYGSAGFCDEKLTLYFAKLDETGENDPDEDEFLTVERYPLPVFEAMIARGEIVDGKTLSAYTLAKAKGLL